MSASPRVDYDYVVIGAGCAGLSLAVHLQQLGFRGQRMLLVDSRAGYSPDRTWCLWNVEAHPFDSCASYRWHRWSVVTDTRRVVRTSERYSYQHIPAMRFYEHCQDVLARMEGVELQLSTEVLDVSPGSDHVTANVDSGQLKSRYIIDTRPPPATDWHAWAGSSRPLLWQHFEGWHIRCERAVFDASTAMLMDFTVDQSRGVHFMYVLPLVTTKR